MDGDKPKKSRDSGKTIAILTLVLLLVVAGVVVVAFDVFEIFKEPQDLELTTKYSKISPQAAYALINKTTKNLTILDVRSCKCNYNSGHIGDSTNDPPTFEAIHNTNYIYFYNTTCDFIIYDNHGTDEDVATDFCQNLLGHVYGDIYKLEGGYYAWKDAGYPTI